LGVPADALLNGYIEEPLPPVGQPPVEPLTILGDVIRELRAARGWSQAGLSRITGVAQQYISWIENNQTADIGTETLQKLAQAFGLSDVELLRAARAAAPIADQLASLPPGVVQKLLQLQPDLYPEDWEQIVAEAVMLARKNAQFAALR